jgi:glucose-1-phosphate thymidylyltransferase
MRIVGVIPAAGSASRLQPLPCSKEVYPVHGRPAMDYLVERMRAAVSADLRVVTTPEKQDVIAHARQLGATVVEGRPESVAASLRLGLQDVTEADVVLFGFPDTIWEPREGFRTLLASLADGEDVVLGVFPTEEPERSDVVVMENSGRISAVEVKPEQPASDLIWGCGVARASALDGLVGYDEPGHYFDTLAHAGRLRGVRLRSFVDIGTPDALARVEGMGATT